MAASRPRERGSRLGAVLITALTAMACTGTPSGTPATTTPAPATPGATFGATSNPTAATQPPPAATPLPTIALSYEVATQAPAGAIAIEMTTVNTPIFRPDEITASGTVTLYLTNTDPLGALHDFRIGVELGKTQAQTKPIRIHESVVVTLPDLAPGTYAFWCTLTNHDRLGMVGTLTVAP